MKSILAFRRASTAAGLLLAFLLAAPSAFATHLRGGNISWTVTATTAMTYTVQFTLTESQRWSYPNTAGSCTGSGTAGSTAACAPVGTMVSMSNYNGGAFTFGDNTASASPAGTITSINQAQDYANVTFTFSHVYTIASGQHTAYFLASNRISTLKVGHDVPEYISTLVQNYPNGTPVASMPAILSVPLEVSGITQFNLASAVTDIDPNATLTYRLSTIAEVYGPGTTSVPCPNTNVNYTQGDPPGFTISPAGLVTWNTTAIATAVSGGNCGFGAPKAGDLWAAQVMVEAINKTTTAVISQVPVDILMQFISPVGALPTITLNPSTTQTANIGSPIAFTATGNSTNAGTKITLNASGVPPGAVTTGLNATVTPPTTSNFNWTPGGTQAGTYVVTYTVTDSNLQQAQASETLVVATLPTISCSAGGNVLYGATGAATATVFDPSNEVLNVVWTVDGNTVQTDNNITAFPTAATDSLNQVGAAGVHAVTATATDPHGVAVSCSTSVTVYQPTSLTLSPASGTAGGPVTLNAVLATSPGGTPVAGQTVTFDFGGVVPTQTATTSASGVATVSAVFPTAGTFPATATFTNASGFFTDAAGDIPPVADTATASVTVAQATTSLSSLSAPAFDQVGNSLTVSTTLSQTSAPAGPLAGYPIVFTLTAPDATVTTQTGTTSASGLATVSFTPVTSGVYNISALFAGTAALQPSTSSPALVSVYQRTSLTLSPGSGTAGSPVTLNATLMTVPGGVPVAGQTVTFDFGGVVPTQTATTSASGVATVTVSFPAAGTFPVTASFFNPTGFFTDAAGDVPPAADTSSASVIVALATTSLSSLNAPAFDQVGNSLTVSTTLSRVSAPAGAVAGVPVLFTFTAPDATVTTQIGTTTASGLATANFTPQNRGVYTISAQFAGTSALQPSTTSPAPVTVYQRTSLALAPVSGTAGSQVTLNATLVTVPGGTPIGNQTVTFDFGSAPGAPSATTAMTSSTGVATVSVVFTAAGTFPATATFSNPSGFFTDAAGDVPPVADTATASVTVTAATTSLSSLNAPASDQVGNTLTVSTTLSRVSAPAGPLAGMPIIFTLTAPDATVTTQTGTTNASGLATVSFTPANRGVYTVTAQFAGTAGLLPSTTSPAPVTVYQRTSLALSNASGTFGSPVTLNAQLMAIPGAAPVSNQTVTFDFGGVVPTQTAMTSVDGIATVTVSFAAAGTFPVTATFSNPGGFFTDAAGDVPPVATTTTGTVTVAQLPLTATAGSYSGVYDGNTHALSACVISSNPDGLTCANSPSGPVGPGVGAGTVAPAIGGPTANYIVTLNNGAYSITQAPSVVTVSCPATVPYAGAAQTPCTATVTAAGSLSQSVPVSYTGNVNVGTAQASATFAGDANHTGSSNTATFNITPAWLTATAGSYSGTYDGNTHALSACVVSANPDGLTCTNNPAGPAGPDVTAFSVTPVLSGSSANYNYHPMDGSVSITPLSATVTAGSYSGNYDGSAHAPSACASSYAGVTCANSITSVGPVAGSGTVAPVVSIVTGASADYAITPTSGSWSITSATSTTTVTCPASATYNGTPQTPCTATVTGAGGLSQSVSVSYTANVNVGAVQASASFAGDANHTGSSNTAGFNITPAVLTATAGSYSGVYDGNAHAVSTCVVSSNSDGVSCTNNPASVGPATGSGSVVPVASFYGNTAANYTITPQNGSWSITAAPSTTTIACPASVTYNGSAQTPCTATVTGAGGLSQSLSASYTSNTSAGTATAAATFAGDTNHAGSTNSTMFAISQAPLSIAWNPALAPIAYGTALTAGAAPLNATVTGSVPGTFTYNAIPVGSGTAATIGSATVLSAGTYNLTVTFVPTDSTDYKTPAAVTVGTLVVTQVSAGSLSLANISTSYGVGLTSAQLAAKLAGADAGGQGTTTYSISGTTAGGQALNGPVTVGALVPAGSYTLAATFTPGGAGCTTCSDFTAVSTTAKLTVAAVPLTITASSLSTVYGSAVPVIAPAFATFVGGDTAASLTAQPVCTTTATSASNVGKYATSCSGAVDANYIISYAGGTLTVTPAVLTVAATPLSLTYGGYTGPSQLTYTITGFQLGQTAATDLFGFPIETTNAPSNDTVGNYTITVSGGLLFLRSPYRSDYTIVYQSAPLTITPAVLTVRATSVSYVYGATDSDRCGHVQNHLTYAITGFAYGQNQFTDFYGAPSETTTATPTSNVGTYPITITKGTLTLNSQLASDYTVVFVNGTVTVTPATLTVLANSYSRPINTANPAFGYRLFGFVNGDTQVTALTGAPSCCSTTATPASAAGDYAIVIGPGTLAAANGNYTIVYANGLLVVFNPNNRGDPHNNGRGGYCDNLNWDRNNWPDRASFSFYWGSGQGPTIKPWGSY
ncbi:MAG TPA: MBG domain-containing protein [Acidobacteriaceae bacterium]